MMSHVRSLIDFTIRAQDCQGDAKEILAEVFHARPHLGFGSLGLGQVFLFIMFDLFDYDKREDGKERGPGSPAPRLCILATLHFSPCIDAFYRL